MYFFKYISMAASDNILGEKQYVTFRKIRWSWRFVNDFVSFKKYAVSADICLDIIFQEDFWLNRGKVF